MAGVALSGQELFVGQIFQGVAHGLMDWRAFGAELRRSDSFIGSPADEILRAPFGAALATVRRYAAPLGLKQICGLGAITGSVLRTWRVLPFQGKNCLWVRFPRALPWADE